MQEKRLHCYGYNDQDSHLCKPVGRGTERSYRFSHCWRSVVALGVVHRSRVYLRRSIVDRSTRGQRLLSALTGQLQRGEA